MMTRSVSGAHITAPDELMHDREAIERTALVRKSLVRVCCWAGSAALVLPQSALM